MKLYATCLCGDYQMADGEDHFINAGGAPDAKGSRPKRKARRLKLGSAGLFRRIAVNAPQFPAQIWLIST